MAEKKNEMEKVFIRRPMDEKNVKAKIVGLNGKMYAVPYDKEVEVPVAVAEIIRASMRAADKADELIESINDSKKEL